MAIDVHPTSDTCVELSPSSTSGYLVTGSETVEKLSRAMWKKDWSLARSQVMGVDPTDVSQNGTSVRQNTAGFIRQLASSPGRVLPMPTHLERFHVLAKWVGRVQRVNDSSFVALVEDQLEIRPEEEVEFPLSEVAPSDEALLVPGAVFYWSIGYRDRLSGQRTRESIIRFRRLPRLSSDDIKDAEEWARDIQLLMDYE